MKNLVVVPQPGDEALLFGPLVLARPNWKWEALLVCRDTESSVWRSDRVWRETIAEIGFSGASILDFPQLPLQLASMEDLVAAILPHVRGYDRVYVPDVTAEGLRGFAATGVAMTGLPQMWVRTFNGPPDEVFSLDALGWERIITYVNRHYHNALRDSRIGVPDLQNVACFRRMDSHEIVRHSSQATEWRQPKVEGDQDPWDFGTSPYERGRHAMELEVLSHLDWQEMVEVGACIGAFTKQLVNRFPDRRISAIEPSMDFAKRLQERLGDRVTVIMSPAHEVSKSFDLVLMSSCIYYLTVWPSALLAGARRYVVTSHRKSYELSVVRPAMRSSGWIQSHEQEIGPAFERFGGFWVDKDGTVISVWERDSK